MTSPESNRESMSHRDGIVFSLNALEVFVCNADGNGKVMALVNAADGTVSAQYEYGPFGELVRASGLIAKANPVRFSTKYQDDESDLVYYGYRSYNPTLGRWLSRDPIEERGGTNLYGFVRNNPCRYVDAFGLWDDGTWPPPFPRPDSWSMSLFLFYNPACDTLCPCVVFYKNHHRDHTALEESYFEAEVDNLRNRLARACNLATRQGFKMLCQQLAELYATYY